MEYLFCYGTLQDPDMQRKVWGRVIESEPDRLSGYGTEELELDGSTYLRAYPAVGSTIPGHVISLAPAELKEADAYEGPSYARISVALESGAAAWVYVRP